MERRKTLLGSLVVAGLLAAGAVHGQTARVQVVHNSADAAAATVDVWLDNILLLDNFTFRTASPFVDAPAGSPFTVGIAPPNSTSAADAIYTEQFTLASGGKYLIVANGIVSPTGYSPATPFDLHVYDMARETAQGPGTDVLVFHGATDAPTVDVYESAVVNTTLVDDLAYAAFAGYLEVPTADFTLQVRTADNTAIVAAYQAPLSTLGLQGTALTVLASGFLDPSVNSNGAAFGLWAALPAGGPLVELPGAPLPGPARVQVVHNSADAAAAQVDVYINGDLAINDFAFRTATPFIDLPSGVDLTVGIAPGNSTGAGDIIASFNYNLDEGGTYIIVANGIVSPTGYNPAVPFNLYVSSGARESATSATNTDVLVFHGSTDAPTVDVGETAVLGGATLVNDLSYGEFDGYLEVPTNDYVLQVRLADGTPVTSYQAPLSGLGLNGAAITVLASGFLDPSTNSNGDPFGLWVALPAGGPLVPLPLFTSVVDRDAMLAGVRVWPNPSSDRFFVNLGSTVDSRASIELRDLAGRVVRSLGTVPVIGGENRFEMDAAGLANGAYTITVRSEGGMRSIPVQVVR